MHRPRSFWIIICTFSSLLIPWQAIPAQADDTMAKQGRLIDFFTWLASMRYDARGYVASEQFADQQLAVVRWKGITTSDRAAITTEASRRGLMVSFKDAPYSLTELTSMAQRLFAKGALGPNYEAVEFIGIPGDGLTPRLFVQDPHNGSPSETDRTKILAAARIVAGGDLRVEFGGSVQTPFVSRTTDYAAYNAGGAIGMPDPSDPNKWFICSTGFSLVLSGSARVTTARHCQGPNFVTWSTDAPYGTSIALSSNSGARVLSGSGSALMFTGGPLGTTYRSVYGFADVGLGSYVCTSGANTGEHCDIKVTTMMHWFSDGFGSSFPTIQGTRQSPGVAAGSGDSGGPVYVNLDGTSSGRLGASGMIQGGGAINVACGATTTSSAQCSTVVYFSSTRTIASNLGAQLVSSQGYLTP